MMVIQLGVYMHPAPDKKVKVHPCHYEGSVHDPPASVGLRR